MDKREIVSKMEFHRAAQFHISAPSQNGVNEVGHKYIDFLKQVVLLLRGSHPTRTSFFRTSFFTSNLEARRHSFVVG